MGKERRLLTVLFADLVGSTELGSETDPEVLRRRMTRYFQQMKDVADVHGGTVEKFIGDAVMVVFGIPQIHDDDAERAVRCGLQMQATMGVLNQEVGRPLALRVGINTGEAVVGSGDDGQLIVGDPINVAARLQQGAGTGEVVVGPLTARLTAATIEYDRRPAVRAKGKALPLESFRAIAAKTDVPRQVRGVRPGRAALVGREPELRQLMDCFGQTSGERQARLVSIIGAAGIGKSRLVEEALDQIRGQAHPLVLQGRFLPYGRGITYWPFIEILRTDASITPDDDRNTALEKLQKRITALDIVGQGIAVAQRLAVMLGLTLADQAMPDVPAERVSAEFAWAMRRYVEALAREKPAIVVIDDLQWAEPAAFDLIDHVTLRVAGVPVLWVCLARPEFLDAHPRWATGRDHGVEIGLNALSPANTSTLISQLLELEEISPRLRQRLVERSGGNPLFCEEFLGMLMDEGRLINEGRERENGWEESIRIPETIYALLAARLDSLAEAEKRTLQAASVVGEQFSDEEVAGLCPELDVSRALDGLLQKSLVVQAPGSPDGALRFKHLLVRDVAYGGLAKAERALLHDRFASLIEKASRDRRGEYADLIAHHANEAFTLSVEMRLAGDVIGARAERAVSWNLLAAERARSLNDWAVLADRLSAARRPLEALDRQPSDPQRLRLRLLEAEQLVSVDAYDAAVGAARDVIQHGEGSPELAAAAYLCLARISLRREGYVPQADTQVQAQEAARLFRSTGDRVGELEATWLETFSSSFASDPVAAIDLCRPLATVAASLNEYARAASWMSMLAYLGREAGYPDIRAIANEAQRLTEQAGSRVSAELTAAIAGIDAMSGRVAEALKCLEDAIAARVDEVWDVILMERQAATVLLNVGRLAEAGRLFDEAIKLSEASGERWHRCELCARRAITAVRQGDLLVGERYVTRAFELARPDDGSAVAESHCALAELRAAQGRDDDADAAYATAIEAVKKMGASLGPVSQHIEFSFARFLVSRGRSTEALPILDSYEAWLQSIGYTYGLDEIARLRELIQTRNSPSQKPA